MTKLRDALSDLEYLGDTLHALGFAISTATRELGATDRISSGFSSTLEILAENHERLLEIVYKELSENDKQQEGDQEAPASKEIISFRDNVIAAGVEKGLNASEIAQAMNLRRRAIENTIERLAGCGESNIKPKQAACA